MKYIINKCYGGFNVSKEALAHLGLDEYYPYDDSLRTIDSLIEYIENGGDANGVCANLDVIDIPDEATDWEVQEYDGAESIIYVLDGKLHHMC